MELLLRMTMRTPRCSGMYARMTSVCRANLAIRVTSRKCHGVSYHKQLDYLLNSLCRQTAKEMSTIRIIGPLRGESKGHRWISKQTESNVESASHDDVIKWKHFPRYWPVVRGIHRSPVNSPHKGQWRGALMFSLICVWINGWVNNREAGDLRRYRSHYDVTVMHVMTSSQET